MAQSDKEPSDVRAKDERPVCLRPPWHPNCYWPRCKCADRAAEEQAKVA